MHLFALSRAARVLAWVRRPRSVSPVFRSTAILSASLVLLLAGGCGSGEAPSFRTEETEAPEPPKEVTGRKAFQNMFVAARSWARDAKPFHLTNFYLKQSTGVGGLATAWTASFASPSLRKYKTYTYSTVKTQNLHEGVFAGHDERYGAESELSGPTFLVASFRTDSNQAFEVAEAKGGKAFRKKNPQTPVAFLLEYSQSYQGLVWLVCYDAGCTTSPFTVYVHASTGGVLKVAR